MATQDEWEEKENTVRIQGSWNLDHRAIRNLTLYRVMLRAITSTLGHSRKRGFNDALPDVSRNISWRHGVGIGYVSCREYNLCNLEYATWSTPLWSPHVFHTLEEACGQEAILKPQEKQTLGSVSSRKKKKRGGNQEACRNLIFFFSMFVEQNYGMLYISRA